MKYLSEAGLTYFFNKIRAHLKTAEYRYVYNTTAANTPSFTLPVWNASTDTLDVYINGLHCAPSIDYNMNNNIVQFLYAIDAGQQITFVVRRVSI